MKQTSLYVLHFYETDLLGLAVLPGLTELWRLASLTGLTLLWVFAPLLGLVPLIGLTDSLKPGLWFSFFILVWLLSRDLLFTRIFTPLWGLTSLFGTCSALGTYSTFGFTPLWRLASQ